MFRNSWIYQTRLTSIHHLGRSSGTQVPSIQLAHPVELVQPSPWRRPLLGWVGWCGIVHSKLWTNQRPTQNDGRACETALVPHCMRKLWSCRTRSIGLIQTFGSMPLFYGRSSSRPELRGPYWPQMIVIAETHEMVLSYSSEDLTWRLSSYWHCHHARVHVINQPLVPSI